MNFFTKKMIQLHVLRWRFSWTKHDNHCKVPVKNNPKFMTPWDAAGIIPEGAVVATSGLGGNQRCSAVYWAMRERFKAEGIPRNLTVVAAGGQGTRGKIPGSLEELGVKGLMKRFITGHSETFRSQLKMADAGDLELQILPQGTLTLLLRAQGEGKDHIINEAGVGTFLDPRTGRGTPLVPTDAEQLVEVQDDGRFKYHLPTIEVAIFSAPAADRKGNIYVKNCAVPNDSDMNLQETAPLFEDKMHVFLLCAPEMNTKH
jgi:propionate CoA-transferase